MIQSTVSCFRPSLCSGIPGPVFISKLPVLKASCQIVKVEIHSLFIQGKDVEDLDLVLQSWRRIQFVDLTGPLVPNLWSKSER